MTQWTQEAYIKALAFAAEAHGDQKVPGKGYPYIYHVSLVTMEVIASLEKNISADGDFAVQCALLHDVIEDTHRSIDDLSAFFGMKVARGVQALSKNKDLPADKQIMDSLERILGEPPEVGMVKMADRITNLQPPPETWNRGKISNYHNDSAIIYRMLNHVDAPLARRLEQKIVEYSRYIDAKI